MLDFNMILRRTILEKMMAMDSIIRDIDNKSRKDGNNLSLLEFRTLQYINDHKEAFPTCLARKFNVTPATVTVQIDRLIEKGHVIKTINEKDKRSVNLSLSEKTKSNWENLFQKRLKLYDSVFKTLTKADQEMLVQIIEKIEKAGIKKSYK